MVGETITERYGSQIKLNFGCGYDYQDGYLNCDIADIKKDLTIDLNKNPLTVRNNMISSESIDEILLLDVLEHLSDWISVIKECYRILKLGGVLIIKVPNGGLPLYPYIDPTHRNVFTRYTFRYFDKDSWFNRKYGSMYFPDINFKVKRIGGFFNLKFELIKKEVGNDGKK